MRIIHYIATIGLSVGAAKAATVITIADLLSGSAVVNGVTVTTTDSGYASYTDLLTSTETGHTEIFNFDGGTDGNNNSTPYETTTFTVTFSQNVDVTFQVGGVQIVGNAITGDEQWIIGSTGGSGVAQVGTEGTFAAGVLTESSGPTTLTDFTGSGVTSLTFTSDGQGSGRSQFFGNIMIVPEPTSAALLGLGGLALLGRRKRA